MGFENQFWVGMWLEWGFEILTFIYYIYKKTFVIPKKSLVQNIMFTPLVFM